MGAAASAFQAPALESHQLHKFHSALRLPTDLAPGHRVLLLAAFIAFCGPGFLLTTGTLCSNFARLAHGVKVPPPCLPYFEIPSSLLVPGSPVLSQRLLLSALAPGGRPPVSELFSRAVSLSSVLSLVFWQRGRLLRLLMEHSQQEHFPAFTWYVRFRMSPSLSPLLSSFNICHISAGVSRSLSVSPRFS